jgi:integrase
VLAQASNEGIVARNPTDGIRNGKTKPPEVEAFVSWADVEDFADEFSTHYRPMILFWAATGLRPAELFAIEWRDVDLAGRRLHVRRALVNGETKPLKTNGSSRTVPLNAAARKALDEVRARATDAEGIVFRSHTASASPINLHRWRARVWKDVVDALGLTGRTPYVLRHTYATLALRSGQSTFEVARWMGSSIAMIDRHYGHLAADSLDAAIERFDAYVAADRPREGLRLVA